jgi:F-type H+-transporting ATPase subunit b
MDLQWQLLVTHAVGFLITLWILKRFAWGPLLHMLDERRKNISGEFENIEHKKEEVAQLSTEYENKLKGIDEERRVKIVEAVNDGKKMAAEIEVNARAKAQQKADKAELDLQRDVAKAKVELKEDMVAMALAAAEKVIHERLDDAKHRELIGNFIDNIEKA